MADQGTANCIDILLAIILPPLGVFLKFGCGVRGVLDLLASHHFRLPPWNYLCHLRHHQVMILILISASCKHFDPPPSNFLLFVQVNLKGHDVFYPFIFVDNGELRRGLQDMVYACDRWLHLHQKSW
ncbi:hypothetical protein DKX38_006962 [Salix brachista]|uniref:Uncharacterized protein n=1 Tax=Salix brachista TaxID=2182728 RepID=A0A5N5MNT2_9ROSI|nr:hypothetical protein DKX38_006962 [Salix brachista]